MNREVFLEQIAARLGRARKHRLAPRAVVGVPEFPGRAPRESAPAHLLQVFSQELGAVGGGVRVVPNIAAASTALREELAQLRARSVVSAARSEFSRFDFGWLWQDFGARAVLDPGLFTEAEQRAALVAADVGLTTVDCAIANTGSLLVSAARTRPRSLSLLPTVHIAVLFASQLRTHLGAAFESLARAGALPSAAHVITGPSRTSDIENDLTIGVHGPSAVTAIVVEDEPT